MIPAELLRKKRDGLELRAQEIQDFIEQLTVGVVNEAQAAAFLMAACTRGLSAAETAALSLAMRDSGECYDFHDIGRPIVDKHSTGGVGDKLSLLLVPLACSCGVLVPMMSGRGLGHTGGTVDKLESIPGLRMDFSTAELHELLRSQHAFMIKASANVAPADAILYALRDVTGTIESTSLITASILSKKLVEGLDGLVLDMKVGQGAFMQNRKQADELASSMMLVAHEAGLPLSILFTNMDHPLGHSVGNWLEMEESEACLQDYHSTPSDLRSLTELLCSRMLTIAQPDLDNEQALVLVRDRWQNGEAHRAFHSMLKAQGGDWAAAVEMYRTVHTLAVKAPRGGILHGWSTREMGLAGIELGAGRKRQDDSIDYAAGFRLLKKAGDEVSYGEELLLIQAQSMDRLQYVHDLLIAGLDINPSDYTEKPLLLDEWSAS